MSSVGTAFTCKTNSRNHHQMVNLQHWQPEPTQSCTEGTFQNSGTHCITPRPEPHQSLGSMSSLLISCILWPRSSKGCKSKQIAISVTLNTEARNLYLTLKPWSLWVTLSAHHTSWRNTCKRLDVRRGNAHDTELRLISENWCNKRGITAVPHPVRQRCCRYELRDRPNPKSF